MIIATNDFLKLVLGNQRTNLLILGLLIALVFRPESAGNGFLRKIKNKNTLIYFILGIPAASVVKNPPFDAGDTRDMSLILGFGRSPGGGNGSPLQCCCLENLIDSGAWRATDHGVAELDTTEDSCTLCFKCVYVCVFCHSVVSDFVASQASLFMEFSRQDYCSRLPFATPEDFSDSKIELASLVPPALAGRFFTSEPPEKHLILNVLIYKSSFL